MRTLLVLLIPVLAIVAFFAFGFAAIRRESEVAMHLFSEEGFVRFRIQCILTGSVALLLDLFLIWYLRRRR